MADKQKETEVKVNVKSVHFVSVSWEALKAFEGDVWQGPVMVRFHGGRLEFRKAKQKNAEGGVRNADKEGGE